MSSIDHEELFEQYYQKEYDFNTASLSPQEICDIKQLVREKRVEYAIAPIGTEIFDWILSQNHNIRFEIIDFTSDKIDGMLYIPTMGKECAYIILNRNKPLINQIFTAAHEYYHYIRDYRKCKETPYICDFSLLKSVNEKCASRFAAELLLPEGALNREYSIWSERTAFHGKKSMGFHEYAAFIIYLTVKYAIPLKAVIYRLAEEDYINNIDKYIENYDFIKTVLKEIAIFKNRVDELYSKENRFVIPYSSTYDDIKKAYDAGFVTIEDVFCDAEKLGLDMNLVRDFLDADQGDADEDTDEDALFSIINAKRR
ncbi:MAG: ImmA/IrrE family metallo-endopeptidase [Clostridiales bacterium]|nr:ImmA/IrrE family metallo-endopeptidase [Clostridiales bacterium]